MGGIEKHVSDLFHEQNKESNSITYVIAHPRYKKLFNNDYNFLPTNTDKSRNNIFMLFKIMRIINKLDIDIVHGHGEKPASIIKKINKFIKCKTVVTSHNLQKPKDKIVKFFDGRISVSKKNINKSQLKWEVIANGTSTENTETKTLKLPTETVNIAVIGRMVPAKGFDYFIESTPYLKLNICCYIIGDGRERAKLEQRCKELNISDRINFTGYQENINDWLRNLDLFVMPSRNEGAPYILVESLHANCPSIATDVGNAAEILPPEAIIDSVEPKQLAKKINEFATKRKLNEEKFSNSFSFAKKNLTREKMSRDVMDYYKSIISS